MNRHIYASSFPGFAYRKSVMFAKRKQLGAVDQRGVHRVNNDEFEQAVDNGFFEQLL